MTYITSERATKGYGVIGRTGAFRQLAPQFGTPRNAWSQTCIVGGKGKAVGRPPTALLSEQAGLAYLDLDQRRRLRSVVETMSRAFRGWWRGIFLQRFSERPWATELVAQSLRGYLLGRKEPLSLRAETTMSLTIQKHRLSTLLLA